MSVEKIIEHDDGSKIVMRENGIKLEIISTFVPAKLRGRGRAARLMEEVLEYAKNNGLEVVAGCSYAKKYMSEH